MLNRYWLKVKPDKTYLPRLINAALNDELFFSTANHTLTVVEANVVYVKPFETETILIAPGPGQTTNVLLKAKPKYPNATGLAQVPLLVVFDLILLPRMTLRVMMNHDCFVRPKTICDRARYL
ncbi:hypothetical protein CRYUN_Cryun37aG0076400 [Craigia yunnanensis]